MRTNFFGEIIATPGDTLAAIEEAILEQTGDELHFDGSAYVSKEYDETYKYGGSAMWGDGEREFNFDGFESADAAIAFAKDVLQIGDVTLD